jgi:hypothetical protein
MGLFITFETNIIVLQVDLTSSNQYNVDIRQQIVL